MIPKRAYFFWNKNNPLCYLRYLSFVTFRHFHPDWEIHLHIANNAKLEKLWTGEFENSDFLNQWQGYDYLNALKKLNIHISYWDAGFELNPNTLSDIFRWRILKGGGWYFDCDQIFTQSFDDLCNHDFVYGGSTHIYVGVIGAAEKCELVNIYIDQQNKHLGNTHDYNGLGNKVLMMLVDGYTGSPFDNPEALRWHNAAEKYKILRTDDAAFYPVCDSSKVKDQIFSGKFDIAKFKEENDNYAVHWFAGHPDSQKFKNLYTEDIMFETDSFTKFLLNEGII